MLWEYLRGTHTCYASILLHLLLKILSLPIYSCYINSCPSLRSFSNIPFCVSLHTAFLSIKLRQQPRWGDWYGLLREKHLYTHFELCGGKIWYTHIAIIGILVALMGDKRLSSGIVLQGASPNRRAHIISNNCIMMWINFRVRCSISCLEADFYIKRMFQFYFYQFNVFKERKYITRPPRKW